MHSQSGLHSSRAKLIVIYSDHLQKNCLMLGCVSFDASMVHLRLTVTWQKEFLMLLSRPVETSCIMVWLSTARCSYKETRFPYMLVLQGYLTTGPEPLGIWKWDIFWGVQIFPVSCVL